MTITLRQLRALVAVSRRSSFTKAAIELHLTQSATSALIKGLESTLGLLLMDRTTRKVSLTEAGKEFSARAERILSDIDEAIEDTKELVDKRRGQVSIAASPLASATFLPVAIAAFAETHPYVRVVLHDILTDGIVQQVRSGTVDLGIGTFVKSVDQVELVTLFDDRLGVVMHLSEPLARKRRLTWADIVELPRVSLSHSSAFRPLIDNVFATLGLTPQPPRFEVGYMGTAVAMVEAGLGISILPERVAALTRKTVSSWRPLERPVVSQPSTLVTRADCSLTPSASAFVDFLVPFLKSR